VLTLKDKLFELVDSPFVKLKISLLDSLLDLQFSLALNPLKNAGPGAVRTQSILEKVCVCMSK